MKSLCQCRWSSTQIRSEAELLEEPAVAAGVEAGLEDLAHEAARLGLLGGVSDGDLAADDLLGVLLDAREEGVAVAALLRLGVGVLDDDGLLAGVAALGHDDDLTRLEELGHSSEVTAIK